MSAVTVPDVKRPPHFPEEHYLNNSFSLKSWLTTTDHKRIAWLFFVALTFMFFIGGAAATVMRLELLTPAGDLVSDGSYARLFSTHGIIMVWFFLIPSIPNTFGNFLLPMMIGAKDMAFPRINLLSWYVYMLGAGVLIGALFAGSPDAGWTFYTPLSTQYTDPATIIAAVGVFIVGFSTIMTAINFIVTTHRLRAPGMTWFRLPLFVWSMYAVAILMLLATPVLAITLLMVTVQHWLGIAIFNPAMGGDPLLFQHMFWFYSHPAVYIMLIPAMGVVSELITTFSRKQVFGYEIMVFSMLMISLASFFVWGHHMFVAGESVYSALIFSVMTFIVSVPSAIKIFNWTTTMYKGKISFDAPMLYGVSFIGLFLVGGLTGLILAMTGLDMNLHGTYFVIAHFHYIMVGGAVTAYMGALHYWWPKITGRMYPEMWGRAAAIAIFVGFNATFGPQYLLGVAGMPRRYHTYPPVYQVLNEASTAGAVVLAVGYALPFCYLIWSLRYGKIAPPNPWGATGLEWKTASPPPPHNFEEPVMVTDKPYDYIKYDAEHGEWQGRP
ncbi:MAG TPA: cbb3-type cytochrome c oxidase subunit I [Gammaproteobacteria bacterium]|nr:cbb3-type cytochrome c oxidase subunit I [Gammaproteobacteria bacterium]